MDVSVSAAPGWDVPVWPSTATPDTLLDAFTPDVTTLPVMPNPAVVETPSWSV